MDSLAIGADDAWKKRPCWSYWGGVLGVGVSRAREAESLKSRMAGTVEHGEGSRMVCMQGDLSVGPY